MNWNRQTVKYLLLVICGGVAFFCALQNLGAVVKAAGWLYGVFAPLILGAALAFILNVPMRSIETRLLKGVRRGRRPLALVLALLAILAVMVLAAVVIRPGIEEALNTIASQIPDAVKRLEAWAVKAEAYVPYLTETVQNIGIDWHNLSEKVMTLLKTWGRGLLTTGSGLIGGLVGVVTTFFIGLIFSFYILLQKEKLGGQGRQVLYALLPESRADRVLEVVRLAERTFSNFLSGQCLEAVILGAMFMVVMTIFRFPYALLVGVLISLTALVPIVGAFVGCAVGAALIAVTDPWKALMFVVLFLVLQQVEGNLIYPHVVGNSVGLPSIWVLAAVIVGGNLMGVVGMLVFIPLCSVLYALFRGFVKERLGAVPAEKWREPPKPPEKQS